MSTFAQLRTSAAGRFRDTGNNVVTDVQWKDYVNQAYQEANRFIANWPWMEQAQQTVTVLASTRGVALPSDVVAIQWAYDTTDGYVLQPMPGAGEPFRHGLLTDTGQALRYTLRGPNLELWPLVTADTIVTLAVEKAPADMSGDTDVPIWPSSFHSLILDGALQRAYEDDGNTGAADRYGSKFNDSVSHMMNTIMQNRSGRNDPLIDDFFG